MIGGSHLMSDMPLPEPILPRLTVLCRTPEQAEAVLQLPPGLSEMEDWKHAFKDLHDYRNCNNYIVSMFKSSLHP